MSGTFDGRVTSFLLLGGAATVASDILVAVGQPPSVVGGLVLLVICALRLYSLLRSVVWLWLRADRFAEIARRTDLRGSPPPSTIHSMYAASGGTFFPFGVRAIVLEYEKSYGSPL